MAETSSEAHEATLLGLFQRKGDGRLSAGDLKKKLAGAKGPAALTEAAADHALARLIEGGLVITSGGSKEGHHPRPNASYRLTAEGRRHLKPARPDVPEELLGAQEAFILLQVFRAKERRLTRSELNGKLKTRAAVGQLELDVKAIPATIEYHLAALVEAGSLAEERRGVSVAYTLHPERGPAALAVARQHAAVTFTMNGETLNMLLAATRGSGTIADEVEETGSGRTEVEPEEMPSARSVTPQDIADYVEKLRSDKYAGKGLIPIHEVRSLVAQHHGQEAANHAAFDPLMKRLWDEKELELISISDNRRATPDQLEASIPGVNETIFYVVVE